MEEYEVIHRPERNRFELEKNGMTAFVEYASAQGLKPKATCSYAVAWLKLHPAE